MTEDSGTDRRVDAILDHEWPLIEDHNAADAHRNHNYSGWCAVCRCDLAAVLAVADAADRAAGVIRVRRVRRDEDTVEKVRLAISVAMMSRQPPSEIALAVLAALAGDQ